MNTRRVWWAAVAILLMQSLLPAAAAAQEENQAGLVIQFADGHGETWCVPFAGETISGDDLLARSDLEILIDPSSGMGITVCRIEGLGCDYPAEPCFCRCMGGESCAYWNYFYRDPGDEMWTYSPLGALLREVPPGGMEAWVWGDGKSPPSAELTFEGLCALPTPTLAPPVQEPAATETPSPLPTATAAAGLENAPAASAGTGTRVAVEARNTPTSVQATATGVPPTVSAPAGTVATRDEAQSETGSYWAFGLIVVALGAVGLAVLVRQRRGR